MAVLPALQTGWRALRRNPGIAGIVLVASLLQLPTQFAQLAGPVVSGLVGLAVGLLSILLFPFVFAGLLGMADEALNGRTGLDTFVETGRRYYVSMLGAYLLVLGGSVVLGVVAFVALFVLGLGAVAAVGGASGAGLSGATLVVVALVVLAGLFVLFVPLFFVQFYAQAIVLDGESAVGGFARSVGLVRRNLRAVFGYSVLVFGVSIVFGLLASVPSTLLSLRTVQPSPVSGVSQLSLPAVAALLVVGTVLTSVAGSLFLTFSVAFYRTLDSTAEPDADDHSSRGAVA